MENMKEVGMRLTQIIGAEFCLCKHLAWSRLVDPYKFQTMQRCLLPFFDLQLPCSSDSQLKDFGVKSAESEVISWTWPSTELPLPRSTSNVDYVMTLFFPTFWAFDANAPLGVKAKARSLGENSSDHLWCFLMFSHTKCTQTDRDSGMVGPGDLGLKLHSDKVSKLSPQSSSTIEFTIFVYI